MRVLTSANATARCLVGSSIRPWRSTRVDAWSSTRVTRNSFVVRPIASRAIASCARADPRDSPSVVREDVAARPTPPRRTVGDVLSSVARLAPAFAFAHAHLAGDAHAAGWYNDVDASFVGGGGEGFGAPGDAAEYDYGTKDLAVDLASPLVAYKLVSWALNQEVPVWLDAIILAFTLAAIYVCLFDVNTLDDVLV